MKRKETKRIILVDHQDPIPYSQYILQNSKKLEVEEMDQTVVRN